MKRKRTILKSLAGLLAIAFALAIGFAACGGDSGTALNTGADLLSISVGDQPARSIPRAISTEEWEGKALGFRLYDYDADNPGTIQFSSERQTTDARIRVSISAGARAQWGVKSRGATPDDFYSTGVPATFMDDEYIYIMVTSENGRNVKYYRFYARILSPVSELAGFSIDGVETDMDLVSAGATFDQGRMGSIYIDNRQATDALIDAEPWDPTASVQFARLTTEEAQADMEPDFSDDHHFDLLNDLDALYLKVIAQNGVDFNYYRFRVYVGRTGTIKKLELSGGGETYEVVGMGAGGPGWGSAGAGGFSTAHQPASGFSISAELVDPDGRYEFVKIEQPVSTLTANTTRPTSWNPSTSTSPVYFDHEDTLAIRVTPINPLADPYYYKVQINHLAADFREQPKSAVYYVEPTYNLDPDSVREVDSISFTGSVAPLRFELDRTIPGAKYQWYEANSWYGGYGFDADGRITLRKQTTETEDDPNGKWFINGGWISETGFKQEADPNYPSPHVPLYASNLDEKSNVSLFNGGNSYRYPVVGRPIGSEQTLVGTSGEMTPTIDRAPFVTGWSSETHYYWVVITSPDGTRAVSARAAIIAETAQAKKHVIFDMNNVHPKGETPPEGEGYIHSPSMNEVPFPAKREGTYYIPITLPASFDPLDYSVATVQARFYLADGTPWVQNWTQGDIGFADEEMENIVLYYNLTNNNATLGLISDGKEPSGGGLQERPYYLVVKAAGEKPPKRMPPLENPPTTSPYSGLHKVAQNIGDAQGWFTPFIELVEVRFEGPPQR